MKGWVPGSMVMLTGLSQAEALFPFVEALALRRRVEAPPLPSPDLPAVSRFLLRQRTAAPTIESYSGGPFAQVGYPSA